MNRITIPLLLIASFGFLASCDSYTIPDESVDGGPTSGSENQATPHTLRMVGYYGSAHGAHFSGENFGKCGLHWPEGHMDLASATVSVGKGDSLHFSFSGHAYNPDRTWYPVSHDLTVLRHPNRVMTTARVADEADWFLVVGTDPERPYGIVLTDASGWHQGLGFYRPDCQGLVFGENTYRWQVPLPESWVDKTYALNNIRLRGEDRPVDTHVGGNRYMRFTLTGAQLELNLDGSYRLTHQSRQWTPATGWYEKEEQVEGIYRMEDDVLILGVSQEYPSFGRVSSDTLVVINQPEWFPSFEEFDYVFIEEKDV